MNKLKEEIKRFVEEIQEGNDCECAVCQGWRYKIKTYAEERFGGILE